MRPQICQNLKMILQTYPPTTVVTVEKMFHLVCTDSIASLLYWALNISIYSVKMNTLFFWCPVVSASIFSRRKSVVDYLPLLVKDWLIPVHHGYLSPAYWTAYGRDQESVWIFSPWEVFVLFQYRFPACRGFCHSCQKMRIHWLRSFFVRTRGRLS